jgi:putative RNA 2'-phosphotransferase
MNKKVSRAGKYMSLLLRHTPEKEHLDMDRFGYVPVKQLLKRLDITMSDLEDIVKENNKKKD